jgi:hypothetical protein
MTVVSGYCTSNPERYANYMITLCKCDINMILLKVLITVVHIMGVGGHTVAFLKW